MTGKPDWADDLAFPFCMGLSEKPWEIEHKRKKRIRLASEFRKTKADGLREAMRICESLGANKIAELFSARADEIEKGSA